MSRRNMERWNTIVTSSIKPVAPVFKEVVEETPVKTQTVVSLSEDDLEHRRRANQIEFE